MNSSQDTTSGGYKSFMRGKQQPVKCVCQKRKTAKKKFHARIGWTPAEILELECTDIFSGINGMPYSNIQNGCQKQNR